MKKDPNDKGINERKSERNIKTALHLRGEGQLGSYLSMQAVCCFREAWLR